MLRRRIVRIGDGRGAAAIPRFPLRRACRTPDELPLVFEQVLEEVVAPCRRRLGPRPFQTARDGMAADAGIEAAFPPEPHQLEWCAFGLGTDVGGGCRAVRFAER